VLRIAFVIALGVIGLARTAAAESCEAASALRADLEREATRADRWNLAWRIVYTAGAAAQFGIAASGAVGHDDTRSLYVGGAKSTLAALGHWFAPLRVRVPHTTGDACADRAALRAAAERAADDERDAFWSAHLIGLAVNAGATVLLAEMTSWKTGLTSFAIGYPVGLLTTYTMPRASWHRVSETTWAANAFIGEGRYALVVSGSF
jgi:hypothetical protein